MKIILQLMRNKEQREGKIQKKIFDLLFLIKISFKSSFKYDLYLAS